MCYLIKHFQTHTQHKQEKVQLTGSRSLISLVQFSHSVMSDSLWPHGVQHARPPCPSPTSGACSNSCPSSGWCHPTISSCLHLLLLPSIFPSIRVFSNESVIPIRRPKYWSFSFNISPTNEHPGLISFRTDWLDLLAGYDLNQLPYDYVVGVTNIFKGLGLIVRVPKELWTEVADIIQEAVIKTIPMKKKYTKA